MDSPPPKIPRLDDSDIKKEDVSQPQQENNIALSQTLHEDNPVNAQTMWEYSPVLVQSLQEDPSSTLEKDKPFLAQALPDGWVTVAHESGGMVYLHKESRVITLSRPYCLPTSVAVKRHKIPVSAVPCMEKWSDRPWLNACTRKQRKGPVLIEPSVFNQYLSQRWPQGKMPVSAEFEESKRQHLKKLEAVRKKKEESLSQPSVPEAISKLVVVEVPKHLCRPGPDGKRPPQAWKVTLGSKANVNLLHEFCFKYLHSKLEFVVKETVPSSSLQQPFLCTAMIDNRPHGSGEGASKKVAKQIAAESTLQSLLPGAFSKLPSSSVICEEEHQYFSTLPLDAPEAANLLKQADMPSPWLILKEYCQRYRGCAGIFDEPDLKIYAPSSDSTASIPRSLGAEKIVSEEPSDTPISEVPSFLGQDAPAIQGAVPEDTLSPRKTGSSSGSRCFFQLTCGPDLCVSGPCSGRKEAKQLGAQALLQKLHPHILHWGTLIEMYVDKHSHFSRVLSTRPTLGPTSSADDDTGDASDNLLSVLRQEMRKLKK